MSWCEVGGDIDEVRRRSVPSDCDIGVSMDLLGKGCSPLVGVQTKYIIQSNILTITIVIYVIVRVYATGRMCSDVSYDVQVCCLSGIGRVVFERMRRFFLSNMLAL